MSPADILVLLKVVLHEKDSVRSLADGLGIPHASVQNSLDSLKRVGLLSGSGGSRHFDRFEVRDFLVHASRFIAPASPGALAYGIPTAHAAAPLKQKLLADDDPVVIPAEPDGKLGMTEGRAIEPLHKNVPHAVRRDPELYKLVALVDALRIGRARERKIAEAELRACL
jgi:hypothetical protein